jgi:hypothetical protein
MSFWKLTPIRKFITQNDLSLRGRRKKQETAILTPADYREKLGELAQRRKENFSCVNEENARPSTGTTNRYGCTQFLEQPRKHLEILRCMLRIIL